MDQLDFNPGPLQKMTVSISHEHSVLKQMQKFTYKLVTEVKRVDYAFIAIQN